MNAKKTECMVISKQPDIHVCNMLCKGERIKQVGAFKYLGFTITPDARCNTEIKKRIPLSKDTFTKMKSNLHQQKYQNLHQNQHSESLYMVHPSAWMWMLDTDKRLRKKTWSSRNVVHLKNNYNIMGLKKSNEEVMEMAGYKRSLLKTIRKRQL